MDLHLQHTLNDAQLEQLHQLYQGEWWSKGRTLEETRICAQRSSLIFALCDGENLVAYARVLSDYIFKAFIFDVIVAQGARQQHLGEHMLQCILRHPDLKNVRHLELYCRPELVDFYKRFGFSPDVGDMQLMRLSRV